MSESEPITGKPYLSTPLSGLTSNDQAAVTEYIARIRSRFSDRILAVVLFGSKARGDTEAESDMDLLVLVDAESNEFRSELWRIASDVSLEHSVVLSPRVFGQARWAEARRMRLPLYRAIVEDGVSLSPERNPQ
jgi:predicted nucleotidyltransferase